MGLLDKLKGHKKDESVKSFDDVADRKGKRSSSVSRKASGHANIGTVPELPGSNAGGMGAAGVVGSPSSGTREFDNTARRNENIPVYPVEGTSSTSAYSKPSDQLSTTAAKDGRLGEQSVDGLSRDMARTEINTSSNNANYVQSSQTTQRESRNLSQTPFDAAAFYASFGEGRDTTTYEQVAKAAVVQETVISNVLEEVHPVFHREHHVIHHQTRIQPVLEQVMLPPKHYILIDGQKHEITGDAVMNHVVKSRDWIPMSGHKPKVIVHQYVENEPLVGPVTNVGASLINRDVMLEHQQMITASYEKRAVGEAVTIPTGVITRVNYMPGQVPVSTEHGVGPSTLTTSTMSGTGHGTNHGHGHNQTSGHQSRGQEHVPVDDAIERTAGRLPEQRAAMN